MRKNIFVLGFWMVCFLLIIPQISDAKVYISEIMYDLDGTDTGREWIEIHNDTSESVDLSKHYLFENNVSHKINFISGSSTISAGAFAIVADNTVNFLLDFPNYSGNLFDSAFSLSNEGEELVLQNPSKQPVDNLSYTPSLGALGTGNSLQLSNTILISADPTPGAINKTEAEDETENETQDDTSSTTQDSDSTHSDQTGLSDYEPKIKTKTGIGRTRTTTINNPIDFEVYKTTDERGKYIWNFGDGESAKGLKSKHIYTHEGEYNVVMNAYFDGYKTVSRSKVNVVVPQMALDVEGQSIQITNNSKGEINIGEFELKVENWSKKFLKDTILSKGQTLHIDTNATLTDFTLLYPNGDIYYSSSKEKARQLCEESATNGEVCNWTQIEEIFDRM